VISGQHFLALFGVDRSFCSVAIGWRLLTAATAVSWSLGPSFWSIIALVANLESGSICIHGTISHSSDIP
jgi:hypothetical protein